MPDVPRRESSACATRCPTSGIRPEVHSVESTLRLIGQTSEQIDTVIAQSPSRSELACAAGCQFCCYHPVDLTVPEALAIVVSLQSSLPPEALAAVREQLVTTAARVRALSYEAHAQAGIPCALLVDNVCSVYSHRPLACRAWHSKSVDRCEEIFTQGDPVTMIPPLDFDLYASVWELARGVAQNLKQSHLDGRSYELHSLVSYLLTAPETVERWLQGEEPFIECIVGAFTE